jgi:hypothetical protein
MNRRHEASSLGDSLRKTCTYSSTVKYQASKHCLCVETYCSKESALVSITASPEGITDSRIELGVRRHGYGLEQRPKRQGVSDSQALS